MNKPLGNKSYDVVIIGAGPSGIAAALELKKNGIDDIVILDRETEAGGIPRHCGHPPFGVREFKRILTGPVYASRLAQTAKDAGIDIQLSTTVTELGLGGELSLITPNGQQLLNAKRVLIATGTRESPRSVRKVSGDRVMGICNTGALQSMVYLKKMIPFRRPVIIGTEIVSFSALLTCKNAGIKPIAMFEENSRPTVKWPVHYVSHFFGVPLSLNTKLIDIQGDQRVTAVKVVNKDGKERKIECDGVLFTGKFTPESSLARIGGLELDKDTGSPLVDQYGRCSDHAYYAVGNLMYYPVKRADQCWRKGQLIGREIAKDLKGKISV